MPSSNQMAPNDNDTNLASVDPDSNLPAQSQSHTPATGISRNNQNKCFECGATDNITSKIALNLEKNECRPEAKASSGSMILHSATEQIRPAKEPYTSIAIFGFKYLA